MNHKLEEEIAAIMLVIEDAANKNLRHTFSVYTDGKVYAIHPDDVTNIFQDVLVLARDRSDTARKIMDWWYQRDAILSVIQSISKGMR